MQHKNYYSYRRHNLNAGIEDPFFSIAFNANAPTYEIYL